MKDGFKCHFKVLHGGNEFVRRVVHVNDIEGFFFVRKTRLSKNSET